jgi:hypothetical protein
LIEIISLIIGRELDKNELCKKLDLTKPTFQKKYSQITRYLFKNKIEVEDILED